YAIEQAFQDNFIPVEGELITSNQYTVYMTALDIIGNKMGFDGLTAVGPTSLSASFTAVDPPNGPYHPLIVSNPLAFKICVGIFQPLAYPITISERNPYDFSDGNFSIA